MKGTRFFWMILPAVLILVLTGCDEFVKDAPINGDAPVNGDTPVNGDAGPIVRVVYENSTEKVETDLEGLQLLRITTEYEYDNPVSATPSGMSTVEHPPADLTEEDAEALRRMILDSGFLDLEEAYGAPETERFYPARITVTFRNGDEKTVIHRDNPSYPSRPEAFMEVENYLLELK